MLILLAHSLPPTMSKRPCWAPSPQRRPVDALSARRSTPLRTISWAGLNVQIEGGRHAPPAAVGAVIPVLLDRPRMACCVVWRSVAEEAPGRALLHRASPWRGWPRRSDIALAAHLAEHRSRRSWPPEGDLRRAALGLFGSAASRASWRSRSLNPLVEALRGRSDAVGAVTVAT